MILKKQGNWQHQMLAIRYEWSLNGVVNVRSSWNYYYCGFTEMPRLHQAGYRKNSGTIRGYSFNLLWNFHHDYELKFIIITIAPEIIISLSVTKKGADVKVSHSCWKGKRKLPKECKNHARLQSRKGFSLGRPGFMIWAPIDWCSDLIIPRAGGAQNTLAH